MDADIKIFDSAGGEPGSGRTDPRGVFQASGISGHATVVVRHSDTRYAFYRSPEPLRPAVQKPLSPQTRAQVERASEKKPKGMSKEDYLLNVKEQLKSNQTGNLLNWSEKVSKGGKGVEVQKALPGKPTSK